MSRLPEASSPGGRPPGGDSGVGGTNAEAGDGNDVDPRVIWGTRAMGGSIWARVVEVTVPAMAAHPAHVKGTCSTIFQGTTKA